MKLTAKQQFFLDQAHAGANIFLTGKAGTGKSFIVKECIKQLQDAGRKVIALAPTGVAANNIDGQTIHSMFSLTPFGVLAFDDCKYLKDSKLRVLRRVNTIFIDEVSMLRPDILDAIHWTLKKNSLRGLDKIQIIFVGDLKQLPAPIDDATRSVLLGTYNGDEFTYAKIIDKIKPRTIELDEVLRQTNEDFILNLNIIRDGGKSEYFRQFVNDHPEGVILAPHNVTVKQYNEAGLAKQPGELFTFTAKVSGTAKPEDFALEQEVRVKNGCKIMYLVNSQDTPLRNGTLGIFVSHEGCNFIRVGNADYALSTIEITKKQYQFNEKTDRFELEEIGSIEQVPIKLAYALSIHKAQGLTFDQVTIDLSRPCFQRGQMYVALSRVKTPEGLRIYTGKKHR